MTILFEVEGFTRKIYKVTGSQNDDFVGALTKNVINKLAHMGQR